MKNAVLYKNSWLMRNSRAYELHERGEFKLLDAHMKQLAAEADALTKRYDKKPLAN